MPPLDNTDTDNPTIETPAAGPWTLYQKAPSAASAPVPAAGPWSLYAPQSSGRPSRAALPVAQAETLPPEQPEPSLSDVPRAAVLGLAGAARELGQAPAAAMGRAPAQPAPQPYYSEPLTFGDMLHPSRAAPKIAFALAKSVPSLAGAVVGGVAGAALAPESGPVGPLVGTAIGAGGVSAVQSLAPFMAEEMAKPGADPNTAYEHAIARAGQEGVFSGAAMALFGWAPFKQAAKDILFQAFVAQPGAAVAQRGVENVEQGRPITQGVAEAVPGAVAGTLVPMAAHAAVARLAGRVATGEAGATEPAPAAAVPRVRTPEEIENEDGIGPEAAQRVAAAEAVRQPAQAAAATAPVERADDTARQGLEQTAEAAEKPSVATASPETPVTPVAPPEARNAPPIAPEAAPAGPAAAAEAPAPLSAQAAGEGAPERAAPVEQGDRGEDLLAFLKRRGGIQPTGETRAMDAHTTRPGLVRKNGMAPDRMREAMEEAGFFGGRNITGDPTISDAYELLDSALRGQKVYGNNLRTIGMGPGQDLTGREEFHDDAAREEIRMAADEHGVQLTPKQIDAAARGLRGGQSPVAAIVAARLGEPTGGASPGAARFPDQGPAIEDIPFGRRPPMPPQSGAPLLGVPERAPETPRQAELTIRNDPRQEGLFPPGGEAVQAQAARDQAGPRGGQKPADEGLFAPKGGEQEPLFGRGPGTVPITAFHGSPHDFDRFDISKIGTGEGAQAYGHGLYFAEREGVARDYRDRLAPRDVRGEVNSFMRLDPNSPPVSRAQVLAWQRGNTESELRPLARNEQFVNDMVALTNNRALDGSFNAEQMRALRRIDDMLPEKPKGRLYETRLHLDPDKTLDWDKPFSAQPESVKAALEKMPQAKPFVRGLASARDVIPHTADSARQMLDAGIEGIRYLDSGSRAMSTLSSKGLAEYFKPGELVMGYGGIDRVVRFRPGDPAQGGYGWSVDVREVNRAGEPVGPVRNHATMPTPREVAQAERERGTTFDRPQGTSNYVVFDDKLIDIERKYGRAAQARAAGEAPHPDAVRTAIDAARKIVGNNVRIETYDANHDVFRVRFPDGHEEQVFGYTLGRLLRAAIEPNRTGWNLNHEAVHALRALGVFNPGEWRTLEATARRGGWVEAENVPGRYPGLSDTQHLEEAIAERFARWTTEPRAAAPLIARLGGKIAAFFDRLRNWLAGRGFRTADDVFGAMQRGDAGAREPAAGAPSMAESVGAARRFEAAQGVRGVPEPQFVRREPELPLGRPEPIADDNDFRARVARMPYIGEAMGGLMDRFSDFGRTVQMMATPMAQGPHEAQAMAKDFANMRRLARDETGRMVQWLGKNFTPAEMKEMWERADAESVARQTGSDPTGVGLDRLSPRQRAVVEQLQDNAARTLALAKRQGMFQGEGLPSYVPRMATGIGTDDPHVVRDIRTLAIATGKLNEAIAGRRLIDGIRQAGMQVGTPLVRDGSLPAGGGEPLNPFGTNLRTSTSQLLHRKYLTVEEQEAAMRRMGVGEDGFKWFTIKENPSFWTSRVAGTDADGKPIWERVPVYVRADFEGPLRAVLTKPDGALYRGMMDLKGRMMSSIMYGVAHLGVITGRALPASPLIIRTMREGYVAKNDPQIRNRAIANGLVPIGDRFAQFGEIGDLEKPPDLTPGRSWTAQLLGAIPGLFDKRAGDAVKRSIDRLGEFAHNTLLWSRVADIQFGLFTSFERHLIDKGVDPQSAARAAAHFANRYAGALPNEAMSQAARKIANTVLFSRTYRLGNVGAIKDTLTGLPKDVQAQIMRDQGVRAMDNVRSLAQRKAITTLAFDMALYYVGNSLLQSGANMLVNDTSLDDEARGYARRLVEEAGRIGSNPLQALNPFGVMQALTPMGEHEPEKQNRWLIGYEKDGTGIYLRNPFGKYAEDISDYWTAPLRTLHAMMSPFVRPVSAVWSNDAGFGHKLYDPNADTPPKVADNIKEVLLDALEGATPRTALRSAQKLATGQGGAFEAGQIVGGGLGFSASHGYPGGPARGEMAFALEQQRYAQDKAMPGIREKIKAGDIDGARDAMTALGMAPTLQRFEILQAQNPRITPRQAQQFQRTATPAQKSAMERLQTRPTP